MKNLTKSIVAVMVLSSVAFAVPTSIQKFNMADLNKDGVLTSDEFYNDQARKMEKKMKEGKALKGASTAPRFDQVDTNKDFKVTFKEFDKFHIVRQKEMVSIKNRGGGNSKGLEAFNNFDKNKDGCIDKNEFREIYQTMGNQSTKSKRMGVMQAKEMSK